MNLLTKPASSSTPNASNVDSRNKRKSAEDSFLENSGVVLNKKKCGHRYLCTTEPKLDSAPKKIGMYTIVPRAKVEKMMSAEDNFYYFYANYWKRGGRGSDLLNWSDMEKIDQENPGLFDRLEKKTEFRRGKYTLNRLTLKKKAAFYTLDDFEKHSEEFQPIAKYIYHKLLKAPNTLGTVDCAVMPYGLFKAGFLQVERAEYVTHFLSIDKKGYQMMRQGDYIITCLQSILLDQSKDDKKKFEQLDSLFFSWRRRRQAF